MNEISEAEARINKLLALEVADTYPSSHSRLDRDTQAFQVGYLRRQLAELCVTTTGVRATLEATIKHVEGREQGKGVVV